MEALVDLSNRLQQLKRDLPAMLAEVLEDNKTLIEDMTIAQLQRGQKSDGSSFPDYSPASVYRYGKPPGPYLMFDTGAVYRGITAEVRGDQFEVVGKDSKTDMLEGMHGEFTDLQPQNVEALKHEIIKPGMIEKARKKLLLNE